MITFDTSVLRPGSMKFDLVGTAIESGRSMSGLTSSIDYTAGGFWTLEYKRIFIETRDQHRYWSYLRNNLTGGVTQCAAIIKQRGSAPIPGSVEFEYPVFSGDATFSDGSTFSAGTVTAFIAADTSAGSGTVSIDVAEGSEFIGGETFAVYHPTYEWRTYSVSSVDDIDGTTYTLGIRPPLRDTISAGDICEFLEPKCMMRLAPGTKMPMEAEPPWHNSNATVAMVEAFPNG